MRDETMNSLHNTAWVIFANALVENQKQMKSHALKEKKTVNKTKANQSFFKKKSKSIPLLSSGVNSNPKKKDTNKDTSILSEISSRNA